MRKTVSIEGVVSILFVALLFVPLIISIIDDDLLTSESEKRKLAVLPEFTWSSEFFEKFPDMFETYYEDHFGLRGEKNDHFLFNFIGTTITLSQIILYIQPIIDLHHKCTIFYT